MLSTIMGGRGEPEEAPFFVCPDVNIDGARLQDIAEAASSVPALTMLTKFQFFSPSQ
jgi:hypothetical protein